jgi:hypothetical protein
LNECNALLDKRSKNVFFVSRIVPGSHRTYVTHSMARPILAIMAKSAKFSGGRKK